MLNKHISAFGPIVDFSASVTSGCALECAFNDLSTVNGIPMSWEWSFVMGFALSRTVCFPKVSPTIQLFNHN